MKRLITAIFILLTGSVVAAEATLFSQELRSSVENFDSGMSLKQKKRMAVTASLAGAHGLAGINLDVNLTGDLAVGIGMGASRGFNSFNLNVKQTLGGTHFLPYFVGGYSRWTNDGGENVDRSSPGFFAKEFLSSRERATGEFAENIFYPGAGIQYIVTEGDWTGYGTYFEVLYLIDIDDFQAAMTGGLGASVYF